MVHAIRFHETGGPEVLRWEAIELPDPPAGTVRIRHSAVGLNYIDTYHRSGLYPAPLPCIPGLEAAGVVEAVGEGVGTLKVGDRVAYGTGLFGAYAEAANVLADRVIALPDDVDEQTAAAMMLQGMTAYYLLRRTYAVKRGDTVLIYAAAGGVGLLACQWAKHLGATVIGTVGNDEKAELARAHGCDHTIVYTRESVPARVKEITAGKGLPVVYDSVGKDSFDDSLQCLAPRGLMVSFGNASGPPPPLDLQKLAVNGSLFVTRPSLAGYTSTREELVAAAQALFDVVGAEVVKVRIGQTYALSEAERAHRDLEARRTTGSTVLLP